MLGEAPRTTRDKMENVNRVANCEKAVGTPIWLMALETKECLAYPLSRPVVLQHGGVPAVAPIGYIFWRNATSLPRLFTTRQQPFIHSKIPPLRGLWSMKRALADSDDWRRGYQGRHGGLECGTGAMCGRTAFAAASIGREGWKKG